MTSQRNTWPTLPQYPPVDCHGCGVSVPDEEANFGYCYQCFDTVGVETAREFK